METGNIGIGTGIKWTKPTQTSEETFYGKEIKQNSQNVCLCMNENNPSTGLLRAFFHHVSVTLKYSVDTEIFVMDG